jgi:uncharacterized protein
MNELLVAVCESCGRAAFPRRVLCPDCGGGAWSARPAGGGTLEETTVLRRIPGADVEPVAIGSVRLDEGPVVVARLEGDLGPGQRVALADDAGAPVARPA